MLRALLIALLALAVVPAAASAAIVDVSVTPRSGADFGESHKVSGTLTGPYGAPVPGGQVQLAVRPYPYRGAFRHVELATTGPDGRFSFRRAFDRNQQIRVLASGTSDRSPTLRAYVFPRAALTFQLVHRNVIRVVQTYRTPANVKLTAPTFFYVGKAGKQRAPLAGRVKTRPVKRKGKVRKGRFRAAKLVRIPAAWQGRFRYASCFPYNAGMGDPKLTCPKKRYRF